MLARFFPCRHAAHLCTGSALPDPEEQSQPDAVTKLTPEHTHCERLQSCAGPSGQVGLLCSAQPLPTLHNEEDINVKVSIDLLEPSQLTTGLPRHLPLSRTILAGRPRSDSMVTADKKTPTTDSEEKTGRKTPTEQQTEDNPGAQIPEGTTTGSFPDGWADDQEVAKRIFRPRSGKSVASYSVAVRLRRERYVRQGNSEDTIYSHVSDPL
ncbi:hypothetical protein NDU88_003082 [Pleurodeles waltl]|uniref:Uncharacterized protein n=1 Tax=Pleurodeles waltl TaxID=8319 RepID=A0AAV7UZ01_PLEWA|nr:hypothetical protein NDU88_003082 [Pleurodeles waltl]